jgi:hypothetical protein
MGINFPGQGNLRLHNISLSPIIKQRAKGKQKHTKYECSKEHMSEAIRHPGDGAGIQWSPSNFKRRMQIRTFLWTQCGYVWINAILCNHDNGKFFCCFVISSLRVIEIACRSCMDVDPS